MSEEEITPEPSELPTTANTTGPLTIVQSEGERLRTILRMVFAVTLAVLVVSAVALFSLYETLRSQSDSQGRRIERLNQMVGDLIMANENAERIEKIEQQVVGIENQLGDLTTAIKEHDARKAEPKPEKKPEKKGR